jgi:hypothetical protein
MSMKASCRDLFKHVFQVNNDDDFIGKPTADPNHVRAFEAYGHPAPNPAELVFDFRSGPQSTWNREVINILVWKLQMDLSKSEAYLVDIVEERYGRVRASWKRGQPRTTDEGISETPGAMEVRVQRDKEDQLKNARKRERRKTVS